MLEGGQEINALLFGRFKQGFRARVIADQHFCSGLGETLTHGFILDAPLRGKIEVKTEIIVVVNGVLNRAEIDLFGRFFGAAGEKHGANGQDDEVSKAIDAHKVCLRREGDGAEGGKRRVVSSSPTGDDD